MKRRDFFKGVTGFMAGVFAASVPSVKSEVPKRSGTKFIAEIPKTPIGIDGRGYIILSCNNVAVTCCCTTSVFI